MARGVDCRLAGAAFRYFLLILTGARVAVLTVKSAGTLST